MVLGGAAQTGSAAGGFTMLVACGGSRQSRNWCLPGGSNLQFCRLGCRSRSQRARTALRSGICRTIVEATQAFVTRWLAGSPTLRKHPMAPRRPLNPRDAAEALFSAPKKVAAPAVEKRAIPGTKELVSLKIDSDVLAHFQEDGPGWQERMNDVLRAHMLAQDDEEA